MNRNSKKSQEVSYKLGEGEGLIMVCCITLEGVERGGKALYYILYKLKPLSTVQQILHRVEKGLENCALSSCPIVFYSLQHRVVQFVVRGGEEEEGGGAEGRIIILEWFIILPRSQNLFFVINKKTNKNKNIYQIENHKFLK